MLQYQSMNIELTKWCNLKCKHCYVIPESDNRQMEILEYEDFFEKYYIAGGRSVLFTGGEIFSRTDLKDIVKSAFDAGLFVQLFTNGTLVKEEDIDWIKKYVRNVSISLDGKKEHHERLRGVVGCYDKTINTIRIFCEKDIPYMIHSTVTPDDYNEMEWVYDIVRMYKPHMLKLGFVCNVGNGEKADAYKLNDEMISKFDSLAWHLCEYADNFHTRIVTNLVSREQFEIFYESMENVLSPWMYPDGSIYICYVHGDVEKEFWRISDAQSYPEAVVESQRKKEQLIKETINMVKGLKQFEFLELISSVQKDICRKKKALLVNAT